MQLLVQQVIQPEKSFVMGGTWRVPVLEGLLSKTFVKELQNDGTYNEESFAREYESIWSGAAEGAYFSADTIDRQRVLLQPEYEYTMTNALAKTSYQVLGIDVGRFNDKTEICVFKVFPQPQGDALISLVNLFTIDRSRFDDQAMMIKKTFLKFRARRCIVDGNGPGVGLIDVLIKTQTDPNTNEVYPGFGVINDEENRYKPQYTDNTINDAMYVMKANAGLNTEAHVNVQNQLSAGRIKLLIDENKAKVNLTSTKQGQQMTMQQRAEQLKPFIMTTILREQMLNLEEVSEGTNIKLQKSNHSIKKDKFSAFEYGLWLIKYEEEKRSLRRKAKMSDFLFMN